MFNMAVLSPCITWTEVDTFQCSNNMIVWVIYYSLEHGHPVFVVWISFAGNWGWGLLSSESWWICVRINYHIVEPPSIGYSI
jgi:hypothetical protein